MDETLRFFIGIVLFLAIITFEWLKKMQANEFPEFISH